MASQAEGGAMAAERLVPPGGRICVVGAGTTGLLAAKCCLEEGLQPTVFERTGRVGGVWRLDEDPSRVAYESLYTNSSGSLMSISDFPLDERLQGHFPPRADICEYYEGYARKFGLQEHVHFGTEVQSIQREGAKWVVTTVARGLSAAGAAEAEAAAPHRQLFDAVFLCTGQFREPKVPELRGREAFLGRVRHSSAYRSPEGLAGKRVVLVGLGNSALDISLEAARAGSSSVVVLCRHGTNIIPVADHYGRPADQMLNTRFYEALPPKLRALLFFRMVRGTNAAFQRHGMPAPPVGRGSMGFANLKEHVEYRRCLEEGKIRFARGGIDALRESSVVTTEGEELQADEVILCTGYELSFPFLAPDLCEDFLVRTAGRQHLNAYRLMMHPREPTLCALGFLLTFGNESCVGEMQARWAVANWIGRCRLPSAQVVAADLASRRRGAKYPQYLPYVGYMDGLAEAFGAVPPTSWRVLLNSPWLFWKLWSSPVVPAQFRICGDHAWAQARDFVRSRESTAQRWAGLLWAAPDSRSARPASRPPAAKL